MRDERLRRVRTQDAVPAVAYGNRLDGLLCRAVTDRVPVMKMVSYEDAVRSIAEHRLISGWCMSDREWAERLLEDAEVLEVTDEQSSERQG